MDPRHAPRRHEEYPAEGQQSSSSASKPTRALPTRTSSRRRDGDDVGGTLQVVENEDEYDEDSDGSDDDGTGKRRRTSRGKQTVRRQIAINYINDKSRRNITFNKRKTGILKKAHELSVLTGADVLLLIASRDTEQVYTFTTPNMYPLTSDPAGRQNIQNCLRFGSMTAPTGVAPMPAGSASRGQQPPSPTERGGPYGSPTAATMGSAYPPPGSAGGQRGGGSSGTGLTLAMPAPGYSPSQAAHAQPYQSPSPDRHAVRYGAQPPASGQGSQGIVIPSAQLYQSPDEAAAATGVPWPDPLQQQHHPHQQPQSQDLQGQFAQHPSSQAQQSAQNRTLSRSMMPSPGYGPFANYAANHATNPHAAAPQGGQQSGSQPSPSGLTIAAPSSAGAGADWSTPARSVPRQHGGGGRPGASGGGGGTPYVGGHAGGDGGGNPRRGSISQQAGPGPGGGAPGAMGGGHGGGGSGASGRTDQRLGSVDPGSAAAIAAFGGATGLSSASAGSEAAGLDDSQYFKQEQSDEYGI